MYQLGFGTDENTKPKIDFSIEDENFVPLMACIFISKQYVLKQFKANWSVNDIVLEYV